jgi:hypothetical protein
MIMPQRAGQAGQAEYGTMLEIRRVQMLADGRSMVETWGTHRFRILERGTLDGYMVGRVERIDDYDDEDTEDEDCLELDASESPSSTTTLTASPSRQRGALAAVRAVAGRVAGSSSSAPAPPHLYRPRAPSNKDLMEKCQAFLSQIQEGTAPWVVQRLNNTYGPMPTDPSSFTFWMALVSDSRPPVHSPSSPFFIPDY